MRRSTLKFALLGLVVAPAAWSIPVTLADTTVKLDVGAVMQNRAEMNWSETSKGTDFDANRGDTVASDMVDFYNRRARLTVSAEREGWKGLISFSADKGDKVGKPERAVELVYLWASKTIKTGDLSHVITVGQDQPNVQPSFRDPSSQLLFPTPRATVLFPAAAIGYGVRYQINHSLFQFSFDAQNNRDAGRNSVTETNGLFYGARAVASLLPGVALPKRTESFAGEKGMGLAFGLDGTLDHSYARKGSAKTVPDTSFSYYTGGADLLFHMDALTADADFRMQQTAKPGKHEQSMAISVQAGYALPVASLGVVVEPAIRMSLIDKDMEDAFTDAKPITAYSSSAVAEHGNSGFETEAGVNIYFKGHSNKLQIGFQRWEAENSNAAASILRIQHQFSF